MSTDTSVPQPRVSGLDVSDSALLATLLREAPIGFAFFGPDLRFRRINRTLAGLDGLDLEAHLGLLPSQVWPGTLASRAESAVRHVLAEGQPLFESNQPVSAADPGTAGHMQADAAQADGAQADEATDTVGVGESAALEEAGGESGPGAAGRADAAETDRDDRHWAFSWFPSHDPEGNIAGVALIAVDVTDRQNSAEAVRRSEERYRSLVQAGAQVVWVTTPTGRIAEDSPEWRWITGQSLEEYLGHGWLDAIHPEDRERVEREWRECVHAGKVFDSRYRVRTKTGSYRHYDVRAVPIERDGKIIEWVGASTDVTGQREAEEMRGRLTEQLSAAALRTARLQQATSMLAEALTVPQVVEVITEVGRSAIGAERSAVALLDRERLRLRIINPLGLPSTPGALSGDLPLDAPSVMTLAITTRRPVLVENPDSMRRLFAELPDLDLFLTHSDERAWVGLPLLAAGAPLGALRFSFTKPRQITEEERVFLEALAGQCALALERASLFEREHTTAETLQRSLLPDRLPSVPGIILEARYLPVTRNMEIGGDWYDAFRLPDGRLAVAAGDVMGKGLTAAAGMGRVRNALRALALTDPRPAAVLAGLDRLFTATELDEQVTTVAYLVVDPVTGEGLAGNAGHLPPLLLSRDAPPRLDTTEAGTPLGWACPRQQYVFRLPPGTTAVLYSDGLVENRRRGLDAGLDELVAVAAQARPGMVEDPARLLEYLVDRMLTGYEQDDDVTVLVLHVPRRDGAPAQRPPGGVIPAARRGKG
ncbi:MAG TPA: SpoIIE family protein phosphatase [Streptosporangiaceae bacterium]|nr:SpoIIE family protein phosphatase [Streptosporangiaceae bacterium]